MLENRHIPTGCSIYIASSDNIEENSVLQNEVLQKCISLQDAVYIKKNM
jgi:hypothetical protein